MSELKETKKMKVVQVDPKTVVEPYPNPKKYPIRAEKVKTPKLSKNQMSELTKTYKMKVV